MLLELPKTVALWATPRSVSTAFQKTFSQRADTTVIHEPFADVYYFSKWRRANTFGDCPERSDYSAAMAMELLKPLEEKLLFFKEMAYQALPYIDHAFLATVTNTFILRPPMEILSSIYRQNITVSEEELGFTALEKIFSIVTKELEQTPIVIDAIRFRQNPQATLEQYCQRIHISFMPEMLVWETGQMKAWQSHEIEFQAKWHQTLENSTTILPPRVVTKDIIVRPEDREMLERANNIYKQLSAVAL